MIQRIAQAAATSQQVCLAQHQHLTNTSTCPHSTARREDSCHQPSGDHICPRVLQVWHCDGDDYQWRRCGKASCVCAHAWPCAIEQAFLRNWNVFAEGARMIFVVNHVNGIFPTIISNKFLYSMYHAESIPNGHGSITIRSAKCIESSGSFWPFHLTKCTRIVKTLL